MTNVLYSNPRMATGITVNDFVAANPGFGLRLEADVALELLRVADLDYPEALRDLADRSIDCLPDEDLFRVINTCRDAFLADAEQKAVDGLFDPSDDEDDDDISDDDIPDDEPFYAFDREEVYDAIDSERDYQEQVVKTDPDRCEADDDGDVRHSVGDYLTFIATYLHEAQDLLTRTPGNGLTLHTVRKIAALAVSCMEEHGAPFREDEFCSCPQFVCPDCGEDDCEPHEPQQKEAGF